MLAWEYNRELMCRELNEWIRLATCDLKIVVQIYAWLVKRLALVRGGNYKSPALGIVAGMPWVCLMCK